MKILAALVCETRAENDSFDRRETRVRKVLHLLLPFDALLYRRLIFIIGAKVRVRRHYRSHSDPMITRWWRNDARPALCIIFAFTGHEVEGKEGENLEELNLKRVTTSANYTRREPCVLRVCARFIIGYARVIYGLFIGWKRRDDTTKQKPSDSVRRNWRREEENERSEGR